MSSNESAAFFYSDGSNQKYHKPIWGTIPTNVPKTSSVKLCALACKREDATEPMHNTKKATVLISCIL